LKGLPLILAARNGAGGWRRHIAGKTVNSGKLSAFVSAIHEEPGYGYRMPKPRSIKEMM
jgi:hypothetical protein